MNEDNDECVRNKKAKKQTIFLFGINSTLIPYINDNIRDIKNMSIYFIFK